MQDIRALRRSLHMTQTDFWQALGVTQSAGSRYESGQEMPKPTQELYRLVYLERIELEQLNHTDIAIANLLKTESPDLYQAIARIVSFARRKLVTFARCFTVNYAPKVALSKLVASLKGVSARLLRQQFGDFHPWLKRRGVL